MDVIVPGLLLFFDRLGGYEMRDSVELGLTIDERLADGFYYAGCFFSRSSSAFSRCSSSFSFGSIADYFLAMYLRISSETASTMTRPCTT